MSRGDLFLKKYMEASDGFMEDKEESSLKIVEAVQVKNMDPFLRVGKKIGLIVSLETRK